MATISPTAVHVLLIEDNTGDARYIQTMLSESRQPPFTMEWVQRLQDGIERLDLPNVDVVLLDLSLPDASGLETFCRLAAEAPNVPIVVLTGHVDSQTALDAVQRGAQDYLVKGQVDAQGLARSIHYAIGRHGLQRELQQLLASEQRARVQAEQAEERYRDLYARYLSLFEGGADAIVVMDPPGRILDANPAAEGLFGLTKDELLATRFDQLPASGDDWTQEHLPRLLANGRWRGELEVRRKDGNLVPVEARVRAVASPVGTVYWSSLRDISERRAVERQQREFLAMVTHELRNPTVALKSFAQILEMRGEYDQRSVDVIVGQARHLDRLISDLLDVAHFTAGRLELLPAELDIVSIATASVEQAQALTEQHTITLRGPSEPVLGHWDRDRLQQIFQNLLSNAVKYSPRGGCISVRLTPCPTDVRIEIQDSGDGISEDAQRRLFSRFYRTEKAKRSSTGGLGLGLFITRSLVEAHGGAISVHSVPGEGSTFTFTLPYLRSA